MTLDELVSAAEDAFYDSDGNGVRTMMQAAVLAVLEAVERECVPPNFVADPASHHYDYDAGYNDCRAEMLRRLAEMKR